MLQLKNFLRYPMCHSHLLTLASLFVRLMQPVVFLPQFLFDCIDFVLLHALVVPARFLTSDAPLQSATSVAMRSDANKRIFHQGSVLGHGARREDELIRLLMHNSDGLAWASSEKHD